MIIFIYAAIILVGIVAIALGYFGYQYWRHMGRLPKPAYKQAKHKPTLDQWRDEEVTFTWIGHSTLYINLYGLKIITDPVFGEKVGIRLGGLFQIGPKRHTSPALTIEELGGVDVILLSHAHMDHFDIPSLRKLAGPGVAVITAKGTGHLLKKFGFGSVRELPENESIQLANGLRVTSFPVRHWGNRFPWNKDYGWTGYLIEKAGVRLMYAGDTAYTPTFSELRKAGPIDVAFMPIGAYQPYIHAHCTPEQAWEMFLNSGAKWFVPIHWDTFVLSFEPVEEPLQRLFTAAGAQSDRIVMKEQGETFQLPV